MGEKHYVDVILPLPLPGTFTYAIPPRMQNRIDPGTRVSVRFGKKKEHTGVVRSLSSMSPDADYRIKPVLSIVDKRPVISERQLQLWDWMAGYYLCALGEIYRAALPSGIKWESYRPKLEKYVRISPGYRKESVLNRLPDQLKNAPRQKKIMEEIIASAWDKKGMAKGIRRSGLLASSGASSQTLSALQKKGMLEIFDKQVSRLPEGNISCNPPEQLTQKQQQALERVKEGMQKKRVTLLFGATSSGKTEIYIHLIREQADHGKTVLYLLPEISLTTQIINRLRAVFGNAVFVYHSRLGDAERVEIYRDMLDHKRRNSFRVVLGARSAVFLPFRNLGLVIVDEEQDASFKQSDPAPRYHARDTAIMLATIHNAHVLLGSATPSVESFYNAKRGKYELTELRERYGKVEFPMIHLVNIRETWRKKKMKSHFSPRMLEMMEGTMENGEQVLLFQNRRGFSIYLECPRCGWVPHCRNCDVSLTYHKQINKLVCHYCGAVYPVYARCRECGNEKMSLRGFGTQKIEDELGLFFPEARVARMDLDSVSTRRQYEKLIRDFESGRIDVLVGTQIVTKGLDFENIGLVGILHADNLLNFPDFRSFERSYQLLYQVAGRAGRRDKRGNVLIQTFSPGHPVIQRVLKGDYTDMYLSESKDRREFLYPPYCRLIRIIFKHREKETLREETDRFGDRLRTFLPGNRVLGPQYPLISRIKRSYIQHILVKTGKSPEGNRHKQRIGTLIREYNHSKHHGYVQVYADVDPY